MARIARGSVAENNGCERRVRVLTVKRSRLEAGQEAAAGRSGRAAAVGCPHGCIMCPQIEPRS